MPQARGLLRRLLAALCCVALLVPATTVSAADPDPERKLQEVRQQLESVRESLAGIDEQRHVTIGDLQNIDAEIAVLDGRLAELNAELAMAEQGLAEAERQLAGTTQRLVQTQEQLNRTHDRLEHERDVFAERTRASFMYGNPDVTAALVDARSIADLSRGIRYVERVLESDRDRVTLVAGLAREVEAAKVELGVLQDKHAEQQRQAEDERDRVAGLVAAEEELKAAAETERGKRQNVLTALEEDRDAHLAMVAELESESAAIEEELRRRAEEQRRAEEARRAAEAARAAAAAAAQSGTAAPPAPAAAPPPSSGQLQRPSDGRITSNYGWRTHPIFRTGRMHSGTDFGAPYGAPIYAAEGGVVVSASFRGGYGNTVIIDHGGGLTTLYAHQSRFAVGAGQQVARGQVIGYIGSTGNSTGPHLHFEVRVNGATRDPMGYL